MIAYYEKPILDYLTEAASNCPMKDYNPILDAEIAYTIVSWIATWGKSMTDRKTQSVGLWQGDDSTLLNAADVLVEHGIFEEPSPCVYILKTTTPQMSEIYKLEDILFTFFNLGKFYGYGVKFREQGFQAEESISTLFENLIALGFCKKDENYYYWTDKTFALNKDGWNIFVPYLKDYRREMKDIIFSNREAARLIGKFGFRSHVWDNDDLLEQAIYKRIDSKNSNAWPAAIEFDLLL